MLEVKDLTVYRNSKCSNPIFSNLSFKVGINQCFGIVGPSGCGKSTLLRTLASLHTYWNGKVTIDEVTIVDAHKMRRKLLKKSFNTTCQMVFQDSLASLHPRHLVYKILREPLLIHSISHDENTLINALEDVSLETKYLFRYPHELSGGQRQRVSIARSLLLKPKILLLDECTSALDMSTQKQILELIKSLQKQRKMTVIVVSHCDFVIRFMCQNSIFLKS